MPHSEELNCLNILCDPNLEIDVRQKVVKNLSGAVFSHHGKYLWLGTDELTAIERFTRIEGKDYTYGEHKRFDFKKFIDKFDEAKGEVDVEGLDYDSSYLWVIGSHSSKRKKVEVKKDKFQVEKDELKQVERQENRYLLARIPVNEAGELEVNSPQRAWLKREGCNDALTQALANDEYLDLAQLIKADGNGSLPGQEFYLYLPSKENGLDIEGLAVRGNRILIGLRGPVLRGIAILLEIEVEEGSANELKLKPIGNDGNLYKRHFLDLNGLGIRELCFAEDGESLLILAGPTMDLDGTHALFRLDQPFALDDNSLSSLKNNRLQYLKEIPHKPREDRAEGLARYDAQSILVVYDSPSEDRLIPPDKKNPVGVKADILSLNNKSAR